MRLLFLISLLLIFSGAYSQNKYKTVFQGAVNYIPAAGATNDAAFSVTVKIVLDVFFGDATQQHVAGSYKLGDHVIYKGRRIATAGLPQQVKDKIKFGSVDIVYDIQNKSGKIVSTKKQGTVLNFDMAGSPSWKDIFPGLSAEQAKQLYKDGFSIVNVRITRASVTLPNLDAYTGSGEGDTGTGTGSGGGQQGWEQVEYKTEGNKVLIRHANGSVTSYTICGTGGNSGSGGGSGSGSGDGSTGAGVPKNKDCITPGISADASPYCIKFKWSGCVNLGKTLREDGSMPGVVPEYDHVIIQYRKQGDIDWKSLKGPGGCVIPNSQLIEGGLEPCTRYEYRIQAFCENQTASELSTSGSITTGCPPPSTLRVTDVTKNSATLSFLITQSTLGIFGRDCHKNGYEVYVVEYSADGGMTWRSFDYQGGGLKISGLDPKTNYKARIKTRFSNGKFSVYTSVVNFKTLP